MHNSLEEQQDTHAHTFSRRGTGEKVGMYVLVLIIPLLADLLRVVAQKNPRT